MPTHAIPSTFPSSLPLPADAAPIDAFTGSPDQGLGASWHSGGSPDDVASAMIASPGAWHVQRSQRLGRTWVIELADAQGLSMRVAVSPDTAGSTIAAVVMPSLDPNAAGGPAAQGIGSLPPPAPPSGSPSTGIKDLVPPGATLTRSAEGDHLSVAEVAWDTGLDTAVQWYRDATARIGGHVDETRTASGFQFQWAHGSVTILDARPLTIDIVLQP